MMDALAWIEMSGLASWVRESPSLWAYPTVLFLHTAGLVVLVGINAAVDLRLLGVAPRLPLAPLVHFLPVMWAGFWCNLVSGTLLLLTSATYLPFNPVFQLKMLFVGLAVVNLWLLKRNVLVDPGLAASPVPALGKILAATSLLLWLGATTAGRLLAYISPVPF